jgi:hypothetical protein
VEPETIGTGPRFKHCFGRSTIVQQDDRAKGSDEPRRRQGPGALRLTILDRLGFIGLGLESSEPVNRIGAGGGHLMEEPVDVQAEAAQSAAKARQVIATRIIKLTPTAQQQSESQVILHLAEAYAHLAAEPPRARAG